MHITVKGEWIFYPQKITQEKHSFFHNAVRAIGRPHLVRQQRQRRNFVKGKKEWIVMGK